MDLEEIFQIIDEKICSKIIRKKEIISELIINYKFIIANLILLNQVFKYKKHFYQKHILCIV